MKKLLLLLLCVPLIGFGQSSKSENYKKLADKVRPEAEELVDFIQEMKYSLVFKSRWKSVFRRAFR